jgi:hypothetical protein
MELFTSKQTVKGRGLEGSGGGLIELLSRNLPRGIVENHKNWNKKKQMDKA